MSSTSLRRSVRWGVYCCIVAALGSGVPLWAAAGGRSPLGVPKHWVNADASEDPVEAFVIHKRDSESSEAVGPSPAVAAARATPSTGVAEQSPEVRAFVRPVVSSRAAWSTFVPTPILWAGLGAAGLLFVAAGTWLAIRRYRRDDVPEVAVLSLTAFRESMNPQPQVDRSYRRAA